MYVIKLKHLIISCAALLCVLVLTVLIGTKAISTVRTSAEETDTVRVPILMYHSILKDTAKSGKYVVTPSAFESDLKYLKEHGYTTVVMQDLIDYVYNGTALPDKCVMLSFDDGYYNNYVYVYPLLQQYQAKAVLSIVGSYTDLYTEHRDTNANYAHISWDDAKEMMESGYIEIQNHTYNLHSLDKGRSGCKKKKGESKEAYAKLLNDDIGSMQKKSKEYLGYTPTTFTYPFGSVSNDSFDIIKSMGFTASLSCQEGINDLARDPDQLYMLKRCLRTPNKSAAEILKD